jgi:hypothetical protein
MRAACCPLCQEHCKAQANEERFPKGRAHAYEKPPGRLDGRLSASCSLHQPEECWREDSSEQDRIGPDVVESRVSPCWGLRCRLIC